MYAMTDITPAKKKLIIFLKKQHPEIEDKNIPLLLNNIRRFVAVVHKIYTEPQARIYFKVFKDNDGKKITKRVMDTNIEELKKIKREPNEPITVKTFRELTEKIAGEKLKYGK